MMRLLSHVGIAPPQVARTTARASASSRSMHIRAVRPLAENAVIGAATTKSRATMVPSLYGGTIRRSMAVYTHCRTVDVADAAWTGAMGIGSENMTATHLDADEFYEVTFAPTAFVKQNGAATRTRVLAASAGWGHSALILESGKERKLVMTGRPFEFQTLLRLYRLPGVVRRMLVRNALSSNFDDTSSSSSSSSSSWSRRLFDWFFTSGASKDKREIFDIAVSRALLPELTPLSFPETPSSLLATSAGVTAVVGQESGLLYTMGLQSRGQCGVGMEDVHTVWTPTLVNGLTLQRPPSFREEGKLSYTKLPQEHPIQAVSLGLQHGLALNTQGQLFSWGKGERGQLGVPYTEGGSAYEYQQDEHFHPSWHIGTDDDDNSNLTGRTEYSAVPVRHFYLRPTDESPLSPTDRRVRCISTGLLHSAAVTESNHVWIWGKNVLPPKKDHNDEDQEEEEDSKPMDAPLPTVVSGLPPHVTVVDVSCASHYTAILLEDGSVYGIGLATNPPHAHVAQPVLMVPPGILELPLRQFSAHGGASDITTLIGQSGRQVLEVQLYSDHMAEDDTGLITPYWVDELFEKERSFSSSSPSIQAIHHGWLHSLIVTE